MTRSQWLSIKRGDIIVETRSDIERKIIHVKRHVTTQKKIRTWISLYKLHKSWTKSPLTHYTIYDDRGRWRLKE